MAQRRQPERRDLLTRLAEAGEDAIQRLGEAPGANRLMDTANTLRERADELQRRLRGIDALERRVEKLEQRLTALEKKPAPRRRVPSATKPARKAGES